MISQERLRQALAVTRQRLLEERLPDGYWEGFLASSALATATAVSAFVVADAQRYRGWITGGLRWLAETQKPEGGWGDTPDSPSNLSTSLLALAAMRLARRHLPAAVPEAALARAQLYVAALAGEDPAQIAARVSRLYGQDRTFAVPILANCALAGIVEWPSVPQLYFELAALPQKVLRFANLQVVSYALPALIAIGLLLYHRGPRPRSARRLLAGRLEPAVLRRLRSIQPESGGFLEAAPLTAFVSMSLAAVFGAEEPAVQRGLGFLQGTARADGSWPIDTNLSVWVTTGAYLALQHSGGMTEGQQDDTMRWVLARQQRQVHPYTGARPGGWAWTHLSGGVADADDTAGALLAFADRAPAERLKAGLEWLLNLQNSDGGWPTFCRGWGQLPFDQSCADITAHALRALQAVGDSGPKVRRAAARGLAYLKRTQSREGAWTPLWFGNQLAPKQRNPVLGTARVLAGLAEYEPEGRAAREGLRFLQAAQNQDGGWGGNVGVASSIEETSLAVSALTRWSEQAGNSLERGVTYLLDSVEEGGFTRPAPIGLYFARLWYYEKLYPLIWITEALGRVRSLLGQ